MLAVSRTCCGWSCLAFGTQGGPYRCCLCDTVQLPPCNWALSTRMGASHPSVHQIQMLAPYYTSAQLFFNLKG